MSLWRRVIAKLLGVRIVSCDECDEHAETIDVLSDELREAREMVDSLENQRDEARHLAKFLLSILSEQPAGLDDLDDRLSYEQLPAWTNDTFMWPVDEV